MVTDAASYEGARLREGLLDKQHRLGRFGRQRLSVRSQRGAPGQQRLRQPHPPQEAARQADAGEDPPGQCREVEGAILRRTHLRPAEIPYRAVRANHRNRPRDNENRHGQPRLQCEETDLPADKGGGLTGDRGCPPQIGRRQRALSSRSITSMPLRPDTGSRRGVDRTVQLRGSQHDIHTHSVLAQSPITQGGPRRRNTLQTPQGNHKAPDLGRYFEVSVR